MNSTYVLHIDSLTLNAFVGIFDHEKQNPQPLVISVKANATPPTDLTADTYEHVPCYKTMVDNITHVLNQRHYELVETICHTIAKLCLQDPRILSVWVKVTKPNAIKTCQSVGVEMTFVK